MGKVCVGMMRVKGSQGGGCFWSGEESEWFRKGSDSGGEQDGNALGGGGGGRGGAVMDEDEKSSNVVR